jgi:hypothetical protein
LGNRLDLVRNELRQVIYLPLMSVWAYNSLRKEQDLKTVAMVLFAIAAAAGAKSLIIGMFVEPSVITNSVFQAVNTINPQFQGRRIILQGGDTLLGVAPVLGIGLFQLARKLKTKLFISVGFTFIAYGLIVSFTRTLWITVLLFGSICGVFALKKRSRVIKLVFGTVVASSVVFTVIQSSAFLSNNQMIDLIARRLSSDANIGGGYNGLTEWRVEESRLLVHPIVANAILGAGYGSTIQTQLSPGQWGDTVWVHNGWFWVLWKFGAIGSSCLIYYFYDACRTYWDLTRRGPRVLRPLWLSLLCCGGSVVLMSLTINRFSSLEGSALLGLVMGSAVWLRERHCRARLTFYYADKLYSIPRPL